MFKAERIEFGTDRLAQEMIPTALSSVKESLAMKPHELYNYLVDKIGMLDFIDEGVSDFFEKKIDFFSGGRLAIEIMLDHNKVWVYVLSGSRRDVHAMDDILLSLRAFYWISNGSDDPSVIYRRNRWSTDFEQRDWKARGVMVAAAQRAVPIPQNSKPNLAVNSSRPEIKQTGDGIIPF